MRQEKLHTCFRNCKGYNYDEYKDIYTFDNRLNCTESELDPTGLKPDDERYLMCIYPDYPEHDCERTIVSNELGWGSVKFAPLEGFIAMLIATPL